MRRNLVTPLVALALAVGATAAAAEPAESISQAVRVADLDLQSPAGARVALLRLRQAARTICGDNTGSRDLRQQMLFEACMREAVNATVAAAHNPLLAALNGTPLADARVASAN
jgi:UrcA family protein